MSKLKLNVDIEDGIWLLDKAFVTMGGNQADRWWHMEETKIIDKDLQDFTYIINRITKKWHESLQEFKLVENWDDPKPIVRKGKGINSSGDIAGLRRGLNEELINFLDNRFVSISRYNELKTKFDELQKKSDEIVFALQGEIINLKLIINEQHKAICRLDKEAGGK